MRSLHASGDLQALPAHDRLITQLFIEILDDLVQQGWEFVPHGTQLLATAPHATASRGGDAAEIKRHLRESLTALRNEHLAEPSTRAFIRRMERPRWHRGRQVSVLDLFADPVELAADIERRQKVPASIRDEMVCDSVRPYLQVVTDEQDEHTGLSLRDIWRYCRYTWSLPLGSQPGRRMFYLVRDAARPMHPIMGIGSLGSSVVQITCRDERIGWSLKALREAPDLPRRVHALEAELKRAISEIFVKDFLEEEVLSREEVAAPTPATLARLDGVIAATPPASREQAARHGSLESIARSPLFRRKRATTLRKLLEARAVFQRATARTGQDDLRAAWLLAEPIGRWALRVALRSLKKRHIGASMMDITTCGAVPPYGPLLVGKLVALLMASPQVIVDYERRYAGASSHIASRMRGAELVRRNSLVLLCTTSLYHVGSSQYNRLRALTPRGELRFEYVGKTKGFGSVHLTRRTYRTLQELLRSHPDTASHSYGFGSGVNYKIRSIAAALGYLGLGALQRHEAPRLVYLVPLAANWREYLNGIDEEPISLFADRTGVVSDTAALIDFWKRRWLLNRIQRSETIQAIRLHHEPVRVSRFLREVDPGGAAISVRDVGSEQQQPNGTPSLVSNRDMKLPWTTLAELVRNRASFAERLSGTEIEALHVATKLDAGLLTAVVQKGWRLYLTGNPGDGKTHIIQKHLEALGQANTFINLDASATEQEELVRNIRTAIESRQPAAIAVNEGPLRRLLPLLPAEESAQLQRQLNQPFLYEPENQEYDTLLVNLGLRQVLAPAIVQGVLNVVTRHVDVDGAPEAVRSNLQILSHPRVQQRLLELLEFIARSGKHVTMHELFGFFAYVVTGGEASYDGAARIPPYYELVFDPRNPFGSEVMALDPAHLAHPLIDAKLWDGMQDGSIEWISTPEVVPPVRRATKDDAEAAFAGLKRRFYFEALQGDTLLAMQPQDRLSFYRLFNPSSGELRDTAKADIFAALSRFFGGGGERDRGETLRVWTGLRYEADGSPTAFVASRELVAEDVELAVPRLRPQVTELIEYIPDHVHLRLRPERSEGDPPGLDIDLPLWLELMRIKRGVPARYRDPVAERRLGRFLARVAAHLRTDPQGLVRLAIRDVEAGRTLDLSVSLDQNLYRL